ncbi:GNAT family N-acetyltransferase [Oryzobacter telluris]|uniref:GNAT family N-acetyltransferase n=1 Tax=Oryzobacter telluris TaxID=3149179 RepID=UPI00370D7496
MTLLLDDGTIGLRPLVIDDTAAHLAGCDVLINERLGGGEPPREADVAQWLVGNAQAWEEAGEVVDLGVVDVASGELAGCVGIQRGLDYLRDGQVNLTYALYPGWRGRGYAVRAVRLATRLELARREVAAFVIRAAPDNPESIAVARRAGFEPAGTTDDAHGLLEWFTQLPPTNRD